MTTSVYTELDSTSCVNCGVTFAIPKSMLADKRAVGGDFYCPNGHSLTFGQTELKRLRKSVEEAQLAAIQARTERDEAQRRAERVEKRARAGVCPFGCKRPFVNLGRHINSKHKEVKQRTTSAG